MEVIAHDLANFIKELHVVPIQNAPTSGLHNYYRGSHLSVYDKETRSNIKKSSSIIVPISLATNVSKYYGLIRSNLAKQEKIIGNNDLWIAAHALSLKLILVTNNTKEFARVTNLKLENWAN